MDLSTFTKIVNSKEFNDESMSLGFRRYFCLPKMVKKNIGIAYLLQNNSANHLSSTIQFFKSMTPQEYKQYVLSH